MATLDEQETTVAAVRSEKYTRIYSSNQFDIARMEKDDRFIRLTGDDQTGTFKIDRAHFHPVTGLKRRLSEETRQKMSDLAKERFGK